MAAALLHDVGKTREFTYGAEFGFSDEGRLLGHLAIGSGDRRRCRPRPCRRAPPGACCTASSPTTVPEAAGRATAGRDGRAWLRLRRGARAVPAQLARRRASRARSSTASEPSGRGPPALSQSVGPGFSAQPLALCVPSLRLQPPTPRALGGTRRPTASPWPQRVREPFAKSLDRQLAITGLTAAVLGDRRSPAGRGGRRSSTSAPPLNERPMREPRSGPRFARR